MSWQEWDAATLLSLPATGDLAEARRRLTDYGYVVVKDVLSAGEVERVRRRLHDQAAAERALGIATLITPASAESLRAMEAIRAGAAAASEVDRGASGGRFHEQFIVGLLNKGEEFHGLLFDD